jgi:hypothetical protein
MSEHDVKHYQEFEDRRTHGAYVQATGENISLPDYLALRAHWVRLGGKFYGPNVEHASMPESELLPLLRELRQLRAEVREWRLLVHGDPQKPFTVPPESRP